MIDNETLFTLKEEAELIELLKSGKVILFLGAGFSVHAKNINGTNIPTAGQLAQKMNSTLKGNGMFGFKDDFFDLKVISQSFYQQYKETPEIIDKFFRNNFTIDRVSIPEDYFNIKKINWNNIYTTNYDDLLTAIYETDINGKIPFFKSSFKRQYSDIPEDKHFNIVHLNGDLNINAAVVSDNFVVTDVICGTLDFAINCHPPIWRYFMEKFRQYPIIILGSRFNEDIFYSIIAELIQKTNISIYDRPKSFIINTDEPDSKYIDLRKSYNIVHVKASTNQFLEWIKMHFDSVEDTKSLGEEAEPVILRTDGNLINANQSYIEFNEEYWASHKGVKSTSALVKYYTNINSSKVFLPYVIADDFYVQNEEVLIKSFSTIHESMKVELESLFPIQNSYEID